jgi:ABC-2 type transport system ATP-binding protein
MEKVKDYFPGGFSKGTRQKVMIMCAMLASPSLYLIDEPFNGLDALAIKEVLEWLEQEKQRGAGVLLSTHVLETAQRICDRFIILDNGRIIASGTMEQLQAQAGCPNKDLFAIFLKLREVNDSHEE